MEKNVEYIVDTLMQVDGANTIVVETLLEYDGCDKEKVKKAKEMIEEAYKLLIQSVES